MIKFGILVSILLLLTIGSVQAENNTSADIVRQDFVHRISNNTDDTNQSPDESINYTEDDMMGAINYTNEDGGEYVDNINMTENGKYHNSSIETKSSPGFESIIAIVIIMLMTIYKHKKNTKKR